MSNKKTKVNFNSMRSIIVVVIVACFIICGLAGCYADTGRVSTTPRETTTIYPDQRVITYMRWETIYDRDIALDGYCDYVLNAQAEFTKGSYVMPDEVEIIVDYPERVRVEFLKAQDSLATTDLYFRVYGLEQGPCRLTAVSNLGDGSECSLDVYVTINKKPENPPETTAPAERKNPEITKISNSELFGDTTIRMDRYLDGWISVWSTYQPALEDIRLVVSDPNVAEAYFTEMHDQNQSSVSIANYRIRPRSPGICTVHAETADGKFLSEKIEIIVIDPNVPSETTSIPETSLVPDISVSETTTTLETTSVTETTSFSDTTTTHQEPISTTGISQTYILNTSTKKFHYSFCTYADKTSEQNKAIYEGERSDLISRGYEPCGHCDP